MIVPWRRGTSARHVLDDALSALTAGDWAADQPPVPWLHWPVDTANPYQALLYSRFAAHNLVPVRLHDINALDGLLESFPDEVSAVLHVHWLYAVTAKSRSEGEAAEKAAAYEQRIRDLVDRGVRLVWTVHNMLPHETAFPDVELRVRRFMAATAELVHVMHGSHPEMIRQTFELDPACTLVIPHPSFVGAYPDWIDRRGARAHLGLPLGARVLVTFGQIRPYKGHGAFLDAFELAAKQDPDLRWLVAGKIRDEPGGEDFMRSAARHPAVLLHPGFVPDQDVQYFLRAADAAVMPYVRSLNSGVAALTASFDLPAFASTGTSLGDLMPDQAVVRFDLTDPEAAAQALVEGRRLDGEAARAAVREHVRDLHPSVVSERMAAAMRAWVDRPKARD